AALLLRHELREISIDVDQFDAKPDAGNEPPKVDGFRRLLKRHNERADRVPQQRKRKDQTPSEAVGEPAEDQCAEKHSGKAGGDEAGEAMQIEQALRGRLV